MFLPHPRVKVNIVGPTERWLYTGPTAGTLAQCRTSVFLHHRSLFRIKLTCMPPSHFRISPNCLATSQMSNENVLIFSTWTQCVFTHKSSPVVALELNRIWFRHHTVCIRISIDLHFRNLICILLHNRVHNYNTLVDIDDFPIFSHSLIYKFDWRNFITRIPVERAPLPSRHETFV